MIFTKFEESYYIKDFLDYDTHIEKIGKLVENAENIIRYHVEENCFKKTSEVK